LPLFKQRVQTYARVGEPLRRTRTRWRFGSKRRFVATIECDRWFPNAGFLPQTAQTFDIAAGSVAGRHLCEFGGPPATGSSFVARTQGALVPKRYEGD
jgi:hypothetical protein